MGSSYSDIVVYCMEQVRTVVKSRLSKSFWKDEGSNLLFLLANLTRFSEDMTIRAQLDEAIELCPIEGYTHATTILKSLEYFEKMKISPSAKAWLEKQAKEEGSIWTDQWNLYKKVNPWADDFNNWRELYNIIMYGFLKSIDTYKQSVEPWALKILEEWKSCPIYVHGKKKNN